MKKLKKDEITEQVTDPIALDDVLQSTLIAINALPAGSHVSAAQLVPYKQWLKMDRGQRSLFGQRLSLLVEIGELPLISTVPVGATKHYLTT